jgi:hypothetical protein
VSAQSLGILDRRWGLGEYLVIFDLPKALNGKIFVSIYIISNFSTLLMFTVYCEVFNRVRLRKFSKLCLYSLGATVDLNWQMVYLIDKVYIKWVEVI